MLEMVPVLLALKFYVRDCTTVKLVVLLVQGNSAGFYFWEEIMLRDFWD